MGMPISTKNPNPQARRTVLRNMLPPGVFMRVPNSTARFFALFAEKIEFWDPMGLFCRQQNCFYYYSAAPEDADFRLYVYQGGEWHQIGMEYVATSEFPYQPVLYFSYGTTKVQAFGQQVIGIIASTVRQTQTL